MKKHQKVFFCTNLAYEDALIENLGLSLLFVANTLLRNFDDIFIFSMSSLVMPCH